jgi:hypothetical protein
MIDLLAQASQAAPRNFTDLVQIFIGLIRLLIPLVVALTLLSFFWGLTKFIGNAGDSKSHEEGKNLMIWGLVGLFVMLSLFGILRFAYRDAGFRGTLGVPLLPTGQR